MPPRRSVPAPSFGAGGGGAGAGPGGWGQPHALGCRGRPASFAFIPMATRLVSGVGWGSGRVSRGGVAAGPRAGRCEVEPGGEQEAGGSARARWGSTAQYLEGEGLGSPGHARGRGWPDVGDAGSPTALGSLLLIHTFPTPQPIPTPPKSAVPSTASHLHGNGAGAGPGVGGRDQTRHSVFWSWGRSGGRR